MYARVVVGTDGSETAAVAVQRAIELAAAAKAELHVVHAHQQLNLSVASVDTKSGGLSADISAVNSGLRRESDDICSTAVRDAAAAGVIAIAHSVSGDPADALATVAGEVHAQVIVIGNRGMTGMKRFVLGSVPNKVSHHSPCDVLIVNSQPA